KSSEIWQRVEAHRIAGGGAGSPHHYLRRGMVPLRFFSILIRKIFRTLRPTIPKPTKIIRSVNDDAGDAEQSGFFHHPFEKNRLATSGSCKDAGVIRQSIERNAHRLPLVSAHHSMTNR